MRYLTLILSYILSMCHSLYELFILEDLQLIFIFYTTIKFLIKDLHTLKLFVTPSNTMIGSFYFILVHLLPCLGATFEPKGKPRFTQCF